MISQNTFPFIVSDFFIALFRLMWSTICRSAFLDANSVASLGSVSKHIRTQTEEAWRYAFEDRCNTWIDRNNDLLPLSLKNQRSIGFVGIELSPLREWWSRTEAKETNERQNYGDSGLLITKRIQSLPSVKTWRERWSILGILCVQLLRNAIQLKRLIPSTSEPELVSVGSLSKTNSETWWLREHGFWVVVSTILNSLSEDNPRYRWLLKLLLKPLVHHGSRRLLHQNRYVDDSTEVKPEFLKQYQSNRIWPENQDLGCQFHGINFDCLCRGKAVPLCHSFEKNTYLHSLLTHLSKKPCLQDKEIMEQLCHAFVIEEKYSEVGSPALRMLGLASLAHGGLKGLLPLVYQTSQRQWDRFASLQSVDNDALIPFPNGFRNAVALNPKEIKKVILEMSDDYVYEPFAAAVRMVMGYPKSLLVKCFSEMHQKKKNEWNEPKNRKKISDEIDLKASKTDLGTKEGWFTLFQQGFPPAIEVLYRIRLLFGDSERVQEVKKYVKQKCLHLLQIPTTDHESKWRCVLALKLMFPKENHELDSPVLKELKQTLGQYVLSWVIHLEPLSSERASMMWFYLKEFPPLPKPENSTLLVQEIQKLKNFKIIPYCMPAEQSNSGYGSYTRFYVLVSSEKVMETKYRKKEEKTVDKRNGTSEHSIHSILRKQDIVFMHCLVFDISEFAPVLRIHARSYTWCSAYIYQDWRFEFRNIEKDKDYQLRLPLFQDALPLVRSLSKQCGLVELTKEQIECPLPGYYKPTNWNYEDEEDSTIIPKVGPDVFFYERDAFAYLPKDIDEKDEKE